MDANVYFSGTMNPEGGSGYVLRLACEQRFFRIVTSQYVVGEASRNISIKLSPQHIGRFKEILALCNPELYSLLRDPVYDPKLARTINPKDLPVLSAAIESGSEYLVTLDRKHFFMPDVIRYASKEGTSIVTPKDFLESIVKRVG